MSRTHQIIIIGGFAMGGHQGRFSRPRDAPLAESTCGCGLHGKWAQRPQTGCRAQHCTTFMASTKIVQKGQSKRSTTKSYSHFCFPPHPFLKIHRTLPSKANLQELRTSGRCARASTRRYLRAKANEATVHQEKP